MSKTKTTNGLMHRLRSAFARLVGTGANVRSRRGRRLAPLQELEDRCLLSVTPVGSQYLVNTYTQGAQQTSPQTPHAVAMNPTNGNYVVVWSSQGQNAGGGWDVYMQRYNAAGVPQGPETLVDNPVNGVNQQYANVAMNSSGNFVVTWSSNAGGHWNIYAQQYNASGVAQGAAILVDTPTNADQEYSTVALDDSGNFVVAWSNHASGTWQIFANAFTQNGVSTSYGYVTNASADQMYPDVALSDAGTTVITWSGHQSAHWNVYAETFTSISGPQGIFQVNTNMTDDQEYSSVAMDAGGNFTITWSGHQSGHWNIYAQSYLANGAANGSNFQVSPTDGDDQEYASIAFAGDGNPIITWSDNGSGPTGWGVYAQQVTPTGTLLGSEIHVNTYTMGDQYYSSVAGAANGDVVIVWSSNNEINNLDVFGQNYTAGDSTASVSLISSGSPSVYGQAVTFTTTVSAVTPATGTPTGTVTFVDGTTDLATVTLTGGSAVYTTSALSAGSHDITADYSGDSTFVASTSTTLTQDVTPAGLTITADDASKTYGQTLAFAGTEFTTSGLVNSDSVTGVTLTSSGAAATAAVAGSPYAIIASAATGTGLSNYNISYVNGTLNVTPATLTVTADYASKTYGQTLTFAGTEFTTGGLLNSDTVTGVLLASTGAAATATVAGSPYAITATAATGTGLSNYNISYVNGTLNVTPATLTVTADNASKTYGQTVVFAGTEFTTGGLLNSDTITGVTLTSTGAAATAAVAGSPYAITASAATGMGLSNYTISFVNGTLNVTPATLTVSADNASRVYGQANPVFTDAITGFVNGDPSTVVSGKASLTTPATPGSGVGSYTITAAQGSLSAANYNFAFANGTLTIQSAPVIVTPPVSSTLVANALLGLTAPHSASSSAGGNSDSGSNSERALAAKILQVSASTPNVGSSNAPLESAAPTLLTQAEVVANRTLQVFSPIPPAVSQSIQDVAIALPEDLPFRLNASRILWLRSTVSQAQTALADDLLDVLSDDGERIPWTESGLETTILVGTGLLASSGYVLLNSRLGLWLLGVLTARPLWHQFDPLEVLYAWEDDGRYLAREDEDEETLMSLVE